MGKKPANSLLFYIYIGYDISPFDNQGSLDEFLKEKVEDGRQFFIIDNAGKVLICIGTIMSSSVYKYKRFT